MSVTPIFLIFFNDMKNREHFRIPDFIIYHFSFII